MNSLVIEQFSLLVKQIEAEYLNAQVENDPKEMNMHKYRLQTVKRILSVLRNLDFEITDPSELKVIPGIGEGTIKRIKEIFDTGRLSELKSKYDKKKQNIIDSIQELAKVIGIGSSNAKKYVTQYNIKSVADLKKAIKSGRVKATSLVKLGLKYYGVVQNNIPRKEIQQIRKYLIKEAHKIDPQLEIIIAGSYRRGKKTSGDIDVLIYHPDVKYSKHVINPKPYGFDFYLEILINNLTANGFLIDHMTVDKYKIKYMGFAKYNNYPVRRIDIRYVPYISLPSAILYFTGPYELNTIMRTAAKKRNMILNEYGLYKIDENGLRTPLKITSEADIFKYLGMPYLTPEEREAYSTGKISKTQV